MENVCVQWFLLCLLTFTVKALAPQMTPWWLWSSGCGVGVCYILPFLTPRREKGIRTLTMSEH